MDLPEAVSVLPGTDVAAAWRRFRPFEALHHRLTICNPLRSKDLDQLLELLGPSDGATWLDLACGHGELLIRAAEQAAIVGSGVDLSPWALIRAAATASRRPLRGSLSWWLGDAATAFPEARNDVTTCLGATWMFGSFAGTVAALTNRVRSGGLIAIGDLQLRSLDARQVLEGRSEAAAATADEQRATLRRLGVTPVAQVTPPDGAWEAYQAGILDSARTYVGPGAAIDYAAIAAEWQRDYEETRKYLTWTVWVGRWR